MTPAAYTQATELFGEDVIATLIADHGGCLLRVAADLLDGLPNPAVGGDAGLKSFKLDVLVFEFDKTQVMNYATVAANLRARAITECVDPRRVNANPAPEFGDWDIA